MVRRTREDAQVTREAILDAAQRMFLARGVSRTGLEHIAREAGVTRGAIYWHFKDKSDLFLAMLERVRLPLSDFADAYRQGGGRDPLGMLEKLSRLALAKLDESETYRHVYSILCTRCEFAGEMNPAFERQLEIDRETLRKVEQDFAAARQLGLLAKDVDPHVATLALYSLMHGIYQCWLRAPTSFDIRADGEAMLRLFFGALSTVSE